MKQIPLSNSSKKVLVDIFWYKKLVKYLWYLDTSGYPMTRIKASPRRMHTLICARGRGHEIDHINRNKLDNRKKNLRPVTKAENGWNRGKNKNNTSGYKGVSYVKRTGRFEVKIKKDGMTIFGGYFSNAKQAALKWNHLAMTYHGKFAYQNKI